MNYYASGKYLVVAESFKAAIGLYRQVIGDDPEAMQATAGFGEDMDVPRDLADVHAMRLRSMANNVVDYNAGDYLNHLKSLADEVTALLADEPTELGVYEKVADKWLRVEQPAVVDLPGGWIEWAGGDNPFLKDEDCTVDARLRNGEQRLNRPGCFLRWSWLPPDNDYHRFDVVAYRIVS